MQQSDQERAFVRRVVIASIHVAVLTAWVALCARFVWPFLFPVLWGAIIAAAVWPLFRRGFGHHPKRGVAVFLGLAFTIVLLPAWLAVEAIGTTMIEIGRRLASGDLRLPAPDPRVAEWPLVGHRIFNAWKHAYETPSALVERLLPQLRPLGRWLMESVGTLLGALLQSLFAVIVASIFLANADVCTRGVARVIEKLLPERGEQFTTLAGATVRSVAQGVIGISIVQSLLAGAGLVVAEVPAAGLWAVLVLVLAVMQLPPLLVLGPATIYVFRTHSTTASMIFLIWSILVSASDGLLKPLVLGRGVGVPTLVILMGAIGGMISDGIVGLFVGSVVLTVGYQIASAAMQSPASTTGAVVNAGAGVASVALDQKRT
jgi:predicted PurR-regulated permease PerM